ncbi:MAG: mreC [Herminiimonas sp.]|nr:mreC [Herminiimonas sp.]
MEYSPPPLFKQGASARAKVAFFALIAIGLLVVDARMRSLTMIRQVVGIALYPLQVVALLPRDAAYAVGGYFSSLSTIEKENSNLKRQQVLNAQMLQQGQQLFAENAQLRRLLSAAERVPVKSVMSEILYDTRDAFTRKIVLDRGSQNGIALGQPVIDDVGVVGQVTRVFPFTSEVTLLTDKDHAISVQVVRSGVRSVAYGRGQSGVLDLRFMAANADIRKGDVLVTSGIDGVYPPGLSVAKVEQVENKSSDAFARVVCQPSAGIDRNKQLLILLAEAKFAPRPEPEDVKDKKDKQVKKRVVGKEPAKDAAKPGLKAETGPEAKPDVKPGNAAATRQETKPDAKPGPAAGPAPEAKTAVKKDIKTDAKPGPKTGPGTDARVQINAAVPKAPVKPAPKPVAKPQVKADDMTAPQTNGVDQ